MDTDTYSQADVVKFANDTYVNAKIDADKNEELWKKKFKGDGLPTTFIVDGAGEVVATLVGYMAPEEYLDALKKVGPAHARLAEAKVAAEKAPKDAVAQNALAETYADLRRGSDAFAQYEKVAAILESAKPLDEAGFKLLGTVYWRMIKSTAESEKWAPAKDLMAKYALDPDNKIGYADDIVPYRAITMAQEGDVDGGIKRIEEGLKTYPDSNAGDMMGFVHGYLLHEKGEEEKSRAIWKAVAEKYPKTEWGRRAKQMVEHKH